MGAFSVKSLSGAGKSLFQSLKILLKNVSYYLVLRYLIVDAETVLYCAEYKHQICWKSKVTHSSVKMFIMNVSDITVAMVWWSFAVKEFWALWDNNITIAW
jgi:hypothetical protein